MSIYVITGAIRIGKSTICQRIRELARQNQITCGGIISHRSENANIEIENLQTGTTRVLAGVNDNYSGPQIGGFRFNPSGIHLGLEAIRTGASAEILFVDELGHLELEGKGFVSIIPLIVSEKVKTCIVVVRKHLLPNYSRLLDAKLLIFEVTHSNRNDLPGSIFSHILSGSNCVTTRPPWFDQGKSS